MALINWITDYGKIALNRGIKNGMKKDKGIDGILVTVGLCVIALLLCVVMKDSLSSFITTIMTQLTVEAQKILSGVGA